MGQAAGAVSSMPDSNWKNKSYVLAAVAKDGRTLEHADQSLKNDYDVVRAAKDARSRYEQWDKDDSEAWTSFFMK